MKHPSILCVTSAVFAVFMMSANFAHAAGPTGHDTTVPSQGTPANDATTSNTAGTSEVAARQIATPFGEAKICSRGGFKHRGVSCVNRKSGLPPGIVGVPSAHQCEECCSKYGVTCPNCDCRQR